MMSKFTLRRWPLAAGAIVLVLFALLWLDLTNRGLAWRTFWSLTGEEAPIGQIRAIVDWPGKLLRPQPDTEPYTPVAYTGLNPYGINTFLEQEVEIAKRDRQLEMIAAAGFGWIRQEFPWEDIEIHGRGDFTDRRHVDLVGEISAWEKYDNIVDLAEQHGLQLQVRLSNPPTWAQADENSGNFAPPADFQDYVNYAMAVAERYKGRIHFYQVWNEPNIYPEWGESAVDPEAYTDLLCRTYAALKAVDPEIAVISGALAPTSELSGRNLNDFIFLQRMYTTGAAECFDILSMQGYGLYSGPTDTRMRPTTVNFSRNLYIRDLMVANGDSHKPIWISEAAWSPVGEPGVPTSVSGYGNYGVVNNEQAARYMTIAYDRVKQEWPWIGVMNVWFFKRASDSERDQAWYYFRMVEPDFTPLPIYAVMQQYIADEVPTLYLGIHQEDHRALQLDEAAVIQRVEDAQLRQAALTNSAEFRAHGTDIRLRWRGESPLRYTIDGQAAGEIAGVEHDGWREATLSSTFLAETHVVHVSGEMPFLLDSVMVYNREFTHVLPMVAVGVAFGLICVGVVLAALWRRVRH